MPDEPGLQPFDLTAPSKNLAAMLAYMPLRAPLSGTAERRAFDARIRAENTKREARVAAEHAAAQRDWDTLHASLNGNQPAQAALHIHQPETGYEQVECARCMQDGFESAEPTPWPCGTFTAIRDAAGA